jgi:hypothetical protein
MANLAIRLADVNLCTQCSGAPDPQNQIAWYVANQADTKQLTKDGLTICFYNPSNPASTAAIAEGDPLAVKLSSNFKWFHYTGLNFGTTAIVAKVTGRLEQQYKANSTDAYQLNMKYDSTTHLATSDPGCA